MKSLVTRVVATCATIVGLSACTVNVHSGGEPQTPAPVTQGAGGERAQPDHRTVRVTREPEAPVAPVDDTSATTTPRPDDKGDKDEHGSGSGSGTAAHAGGGAEGSTGHGQADHGGSGTGASTGGQGQSNHGHPVGGSADSSSEQGFNPPAPVPAPAVDTSASDDAGTATGSTGQSEKKPTKTVDKDDGTQTRRPRKSTRPRMNAAEEDKPPRPTKSFRSGPALSRLRERW